MKRAVRNFVLVLIMACGTGLAGSIAAPAAHALPAPLTQVAASCDTGGFFGFPSWDACLQHTADGTPQITKLSDLWLIGFPLVTTMVKAAGYLAAGFIIWGGVKYIKSTGNPSEITAAKTVIQNAIIGLIICIISVAAVQFVAGAF